MNVSLRWNKCTNSIDYYDAFGFHLYMPRRLPLYYFSHISSNKLATTHFKRISFYFLDCNIYLGIMLNHNYDWIQNHFTLLQNRIAADKSFHGFSSPIFMNRYNYCGISKKLIPRAQCVLLLASCISELRRFLMGLISALLLSKKLGKFRMNLNFGSNISWEIKFHLIPTYSEAFALEACEDPHQQTQCSLSDPWITP